jgi:hypothetical protein
LLCKTYNILLKVTNYYYNSNYYIKILILLQNYKNESKLILIKFIIVKNYLK